VTVLSLLALMLTTSLSASTVSPEIVYVYQPPSTIAHDCSVDVSSSLSSWIATVPNGSALSFAPGGCYRLESTVEIRNRSGLTFEGNGATFRSYNAPDDQRAMWRVIDSSGFVFRDMTLQGSYANGGSFTSSLQHAHGIDLRGTSAEIANVTALNFAGDCVYFGLGYSSLTRSSGSVHDSSCSRTGRNGISVTAGDNIRIERVTTDQIGFIAFDIEPNVGSGFGSQGVVVTGNTIGSYYLYAWALVENAPLSDQSFTSNTITANKGLRIAALNGGQGFRAKGVNVSGNKASSATWSGAMEMYDIDQLTVTGNTVPLSSGTMATVDSSCAVSVSGNTYTGGSSEVQITNATTACASTTSTAPSISSFTPTSGPTGTSVTVSGAGFTGATGVTVGGVAASYTVNSDSKITLKVPSAATSGPIRVVTPAGAATSSTSFTVTVPSAPSNAPTISLFTPTSGPAGTLVVITGTNFTGATSVEFSDGDSIALFTVDSDSQITAIVPSGATSGRIIVRTPDGWVKSVKRFRVR
jgi:hypothetical protein